MEDIKKFINNIKKVSSHRKHKVTNSYGVHDGFKFYRKTRPKEHKYVLTSSQYYSIIRRINILLREELFKGNDIILPARMGRLELRKYNTYITINEEKVKTNLPIDWDRTIRLWYEDEESYKNKTLVKAEEKEIYKIHYNKHIANYKNKSFYQFTANRELKKALKNIIKDNNDIGIFNL